MLGEPVDHSAMHACGYAWPWSLRAGGRVSLHASCDDPAARVSLRRLDGPTGDVAWPVSPGSEPLGPRSIVHGSWAELSGLAPAAGTALRLELLVTRNASSRRMLSWGALSLGVDPLRRLTLASGDRETGCGAVLPSWRWLVLELRWDGQGVSAVASDATSGRVLSLLRLDALEPPPASATLLLGRGQSGPAANWRLGRVSFDADDLLAQWHLPARGPVAEVAPIGGVGPVLRVRNDPTFACASARWDGSADDPRLAADHYDAIHLHEDDVGPLDWPATLVADVPTDAPSGVYAFVIATRRGNEQVPFFVRPDTPRAAIAFLAPTLTYAAYADEALPPERFPWVCDDRSHRFARANGLLSLYDEHADGSGVSTKSLRHPKSTLRDDYLYPLSGSPHLLPVDLDLLAFCRAQGISFDILTDGDLHAEGASALERYAGVFTGSHPEYWTAPMQEALARWLLAGGNLACLGGNGLMWVTALDGERVEVRRGRTLASRTWDGLPGESAMALTGELGGLWRERGRPEFGVTGTGMTLMGFGPARPFLRLAGPETEQWDWVFDGVPPGPIGRGGRVLGGAAGYEVDRADERLGTPMGTVVLARAEGFGPEYESDANEYFPGGASERDASRRADLAARFHEGGGFVVSVGSVAWCGALPLHGSADGIGALTANILRGLSRRLR